MTITERRDADQVRTGRHVLSDEVLAGFRSRAAVADDRNEYFHEDFAILRDSGYLAAAVPQELGGWGDDLVTLGATQRRIARFAPATALAMCMHHYWVGMAVEHERAGDTSLRWILERAVDGEVFAAGHAEAGNDSPVVMSTATAERVEGGYRLNGHKQFGSNGPVWSFLGAHALDASDPEHPVVVHAFVDRDAPGVTVVPRWDTLGMRPSQSYETTLEGVFVPDERIGAVTPAGDPTSLFVAAMQLWFVGLVGNVYLGIADRALELAVASATKKTSVAIPRGTYAHNPMVQHQVSEMFLELDAASSAVDRLTADWVAGVDHAERWGPIMLSTKWRAVEAAKRVVDRALDVSGGGGMMRGNELERLYRDVRCGGFHPANDALVHELVGKILLGVDPAGPRW